MNEESKSKEKPKGLTTDTMKMGGGFTVTFWVGILVVYLLLFMGTGYVAFFTEEFNPALTLQPEYVAELTDTDTKAFVIDTLKEEGQNYQKRRELASQSFNVVLGAILGFLSASAAFVFGRKSTA